MKSTVASHSKRIITLALGLLLAASCAGAQTLPGLWGSSLYRVTVTVSGTSVTGTFTSVDNPQAPAGTLVGQLLPGGLAFTADWTIPLGTDTGAFKTWLSFSAKGALLDGTRWTDQNFPTNFALHRAVNGQIPELPSGADAIAPPPPKGKPTTTTAGLPLLTGQSYNGGAGTQPSGASNAQPLVLFDSSNTALVDNRPTAPTRFRLQQCYRLTDLQNYHWNGGKGALLGTIGLKDAGGSTYGPWQAQGLVGTGGERYTFWVVKPNVVLPPGVYTIVDSSPATWSRNAQSKGCGFSTVSGVPAQASATPSTVSAAEPTGTTHLTLCTALANSRPVDPGTTFTSPNMIYCFMDFQGLASGSVISCDWSRDGRALTTSKTTIGAAAGWLWFSYKAGQGATLTRGTYRVKVYTAGGAIGTQTCAVK